MLEKREIDKLKKENRSIVTTIRLTPGEKKFLEKQKLSLGKIVRYCLEDLGYKK